MKEAGSFTRTSGSLLHLEREFLRPYRGWILLAIAGMIVQGALALAIPLAQSRAIDHLTASPGSATFAARTAWIAMGAMFACILCRAFVQQRVGRLMNRITLEAVNALTDAVHRQYQRVALIFLEERPTGDLIARITSDVGTLMIFLNSGTLQLAGDLSLALFVPAALFWLNAPLALATLLTLPLFALLEVWFRRGLQRESDRVRGTLGSIYTFFTERLAMLTMIRAFGQQAAEIDRLDARQHDHVSASMRGVKLTAAQAAAALAAAGGATVLIVALGVRAVADGRMSPGEFLAFYALAGQLLTPIVRLIQFQSGLAQTKVAAGRILEVLHEPAFLPAERRSVFLPAESRRCIPANHLGVRLTDVSFRYCAESRSILGGINLDVSPGELVLISGASGAGKSTLLAIVARHYLCRQGSVTLGPAPLQEWEADRFRKAVALVPQRSQLLRGTLRHNLAYGAPAATEEELWKILELVELDDWVLRLPRGLDTNLGAGASDLSGGQRQRLCLARTLLAETPVLLLDDAMSALDSATSERIWRRLATPLANRVCIAVVSDPAAVPLACRRLVLSDGRLSELRPSHLSQFAAA